MARRLQRLSEKGARTGGQVLIEPLQIAVQQAHDVSAMGAGFNYPWGDNLGDETAWVALAYIIHDLGDKLIRSWEYVKTQDAYADSGK